MDDLETTDLDGPPATLVETAPPEEDEPPAALVVTCEAGAPEGTQADALASHLGLSLREVRERFRDPLPRVVERGPASRITAAVDALQAAGVDAMAFTHDAILDALRPFEVQAVRVDDGSHLVLGGPQGEVRLDRTRPSFLVVGAFDGTPACFGHLYAGDRDEPLLLREEAIGDWSFLGFDRGPDRRKNFEKLLALLAGSSGVRQDDRLLVHRDRLATREAADTASRVLFHRWCTAQGHDAAALASALEVLSTAPIAAAASAGGLAAMPLPLPPPAPAAPATGRLLRAGGPRPSGRLPDRERPRAPDPPPGRPTAPLPPRLSPRRPDGTAYCTTCRLLRPVSHFGRCLVCSLEIATMAAPTRSAALVYALGAWWRLLLAVGLITLGVLLYRSHPKSGGGIGFVGLLHGAVWLVERLFGVHLRLFDYLRIGSRS